MLAANKQTQQDQNKKVYVIKGLQWSRGQSITDVTPYEIARFTRFKEARGQVRHQRNSKGELLLEKYWEYYWIFEYFEESEFYFGFRISDLSGMEHEAHIFLEAQENDLGTEVD